MSKENQSVSIIEAPELKSIEEGKAEIIRATFKPMATMLEGFETEYSNVIGEYLTAKDTDAGITKEITNRAKRLRIDIGRVRISTEKLRKEQKEEYLRAGKAIDGVSNILKWAVSDKEKKLKEIEKHFEIKEQERIEALQQVRAEVLSGFVDDAYDRELGSMDEEVWDAYLSAKEKQFNDRIEAEKKAEAERAAKEKAEAEERDRIRVENEKLKKEAEAAEKKRIEEKKKLDAIEKKRLAKEEAERIERERVAKVERDKHEAAIKAEQEKRRKVEEVEREKREALEAELKAKEEAERVERERVEATKQAELRKGDADKVSDLIADLESLKSKYSFDSDDNIKTFNDVKSLIDKTVVFIKGRCDL